MRFALLAAVVLLAAIGASHAQNGTNVARYDNYRLYRVHITTDAQVAMLQELELRSDSCIFYGHARRIGQRLTILVSAHKIADFAELLERYALEHQLLNENFQASIDEQFASVRPRTTPGYRMQWRNYFHLDTIYAWMDFQARRNPDDVQLLDLGASHDGRRIRGIKLSRGPKTTPRTGVFLEAGIHSREWISPATATFLLNQLLQSDEPAVRSVAERFDFYVVPVVNPDGYAYTFDADRMWRKTRQPHGLVCVGTDMNRNFASNWNGTGSSPDPCAFDFAGAREFSEPEAQRVAEWLRANRNESRIETYIALHSFSQMLMFPLGHTAERVENYADLMAIGREGVRALEGRFGTVFQMGSKFETIYPSSGGSIDWAFTEQRVPVAFSFELRGAPDSEVMFNLPAEQIEPVGLETLDAVVAMLVEAQRLGYYEV